MARLHHRDASFDAVDGTVEFVEDVATSRDDRGKHAAQDNHRIDVAKCGYLLWWEVAFKVCRRKFGNEGVGGNQDSGNGCDLDPSSSRKHRNDEQRDYSDDRACKSWQDFVEVDHFIASLLGFRYRRPLRSPFLRGFNSRK